MKAALLIFATFSVFAQSSLEDCAQNAESYGSPNSGAYMPVNCESLVIEGGHKSSKDLSSVSGLYNMLYVQNAGDNPQLIAGAQTRLSQVEQVELVPQESRAYVLNFDGEAKSILSFKVDSGGNVSPVRKLISEELSKASGFGVDYDGQKLFAYSSQERWIRSFQLHADPDGRTPANSTKKIGEIKLNTAPMKIVVAGDQLTTLVSGEILVFNKNLKESEPKQILDVTELDNISDVEFDQSKNALVVKNHEGADIVFLKDSSGYFARVD